MSIVDELRKIPVFADQPEEHLAWLAGHATEVSLASGERFLLAGAPADRFFVLFEGEIEGRVAGAGSFFARAGDVTGLLPFSRMKQFPSDIHAVAATRIGSFSSSLFPEMFQRMPEVIARMVGLLTDRVRTTTRMDDQREKLAALGKLSAGLAHELNNPAAAARRAASSLGQLMVTARENNVALNDLPLTPQQREYIARFERDTGDRAATGATSLASLEQSDREEQLERWLDAHHVDDGWKLAPVFVEAGITEAELDALVAQIGTQPLNEVLGRVAVLVSAAGLIREIEHSTARISELVKAIKEYSYMDQAPEQEIDIHSGLDNTLTMMSHKIRKAEITVAREYDRSLPKICAWGSELNQVWTNLIDNAIDAMTANGTGHQRKLTIRTARDPIGIMVEIADTGPGVPKEIQSRIFDPFFTTKAVGQGTGLGLDVACRIIRKHHGDICIGSSSEGARFQVRLPQSRN